MIAVSVHGGTRSVPKNKTKIWGKEANTEFIFIYIRAPVAWWPRMYFVRTDDYYNKPYYDFCRTELLKVWSQLGPRLLRRSARLTWLWLDIVGPA